jgi:Tol biopolymer transport system component
MWPRLSGPRQLIPSALSAPAVGGPAIDRSRARQITQGGRKLDGYNGVAWTNDGRITYTSTAGGSHDIWIMEADGTGQKQLTGATDGNANQNQLYQSVSPDGRYILFTSDRVSGVPHIWRMDSNGGNLKQLTNGAGEGLQQVTPDGRSVVYFETRASHCQRFRLTAANQPGLPIMLIAGPLFLPTAS